MNFLPKIHTYFSMSTITAISCPEKIKRPYLSIIRQLTKSKYKFFVATPVHNEVSIHYFQACLEFQKQCMKKDVLSCFQVMKSSLVTQGRNLCVSSFMETNSTHLLFIDGDISFDPKDVDKLIVSNKDVICSPYPKKYIKLENVLKQNHELVDFAVSGNVKQVGESLYEIDSVATGFLLIKREVFEKILIFNKNLSYINDIDGYGIGNKMWDFFKVGIKPMIHFVVKTVGRL